ncbi:MAG: succinate dehydrogenase assembly factor 2 [Pseudomonadota bacterium]
MTDAAPLDTRRRRLTFHAWHRGIREMDLLFGRYMDAHVRDMSDDELDEIEALMRLPDQELLKWIDGRESAPANQNTALIGRIRDYSMANPVTSDSGTAH